MLDVGCSTGYLGQELIRRGYKVYGIELDAYVAAEAYQDFLNLEYQHKL